MIKYSLATAFSGGKIDNDSNKQAFECAYSYNYTLQIKEMTFNSC